jgi:DNA repair protein RadA/Sms
MPKASAKTVYVCQSCGAVHAKWAGRCSSCGDWNTLTEEIAETKGAKKQIKGAKSPVETYRLSEITGDTSYRIISGNAEFDRAVGRGIVPGSSILIGGDPGIGKSTLLLQQAGLYASEGFMSLYVTGEESQTQIKIRADRLEIDTDMIDVACLIDTDEIITALNQREYKFLIIDSIQTLKSAQLESSSGTVSQIRESVSTILDICQVKEVTAFLIGHVTKEGMIAGPKVLEHMVDVVLYFEGERNHMFRILRSEKNRYGPTNEIGIFSIESSGLKPVSNPSEVFISGRSGNEFGSVITAAMEGSRPILIELQALVGGTTYGYPQRVTSGFDPKRLALLLAILEKRQKIPFGDKDVFVNITGGLRIFETAIDLAIVIALVSSLEEAAVKDGTIVIGEVGLGGEIRQVPSLERRLMEAQRLGFERAIIPDGVKLDRQALKNMQLEKASALSDAISLALA